MIDTVLFDLDATLVDDGYNWRRSVVESIRFICEGHPLLDVDEVRAAYDAAAGSVWEHIRGIEAAPWGNMDDEEIVRRVWKESLAAVRLNDPELLEATVGRYIDLRRSGAPAFDDAKGCLDNLVSNYRLGIVTNGLLVHQAPKLETSGLTGYFTVVASSRRPTWASGSPDPRSSYAPSRPWDLALRPRLTWVIPCPGTSAAPTGPVCSPSG